MSRFGVALQHLAIWAFAAGWVVGIVWAVTRFCMELVS